MEEQQTFTTQGREVLQLESPSRQSVVEKTLTSADKQEIYGSSPEGTIFFGGRNQTL